MNKLLVNAPSGVQDVVNVGQGGKYFDDARVLWDERTDGPMPAIQLGGMVRSGNALVVDSALLTAAQAAADAKTAEAARVEAIEQTMRTDTVVASLKAMTNAEFDTWWAANVTTLAQALGVLKRLTRFVVRKLA